MVKFYKNYKKFKYLIKITYFSFFLKICIYPQTCMYIWGWGLKSSYDDMISAVGDFFLSMGSKHCNTNENMWRLRGGTMLKKKTLFGQILWEYLSQPMNFSANPHMYVCIYLHIYIRVYVHVYIYIYIYMRVKENSFENLIEFITNSKQKGGKCNNYLKTIYA